MALVCIPYDRITLQPYNLITLQPHDRTALNPLVFLVPLDGFTHSFGQSVARTEAELGHGRADVAPPVALPHDFILVVVERGQPAGKPPYALSCGGDYAQKPQRSLDAEQPGVAQFAAYEVAECARRIHTAVAKKVS